MSKAARLAAAQETAQWLRDHYPKLFATTRPPPLAVGIHRQIKERHPHLGGTALAAALHRHTHRLAYLFALSQPGAMRIDLEGQPVEPV